MAGSVTQERPRVVVVGGGIAGLAAAWFLTEPGPGPTPEVVVLEAGDRVGGKLRLAEVAGVHVDVGAEAMLARRPEGMALARAAGLTVVHPDLASSRIWTRGALRRLPRSLMGVPLDLEELEESGVLSAEGLARVRAEPSCPRGRLDEDLSVGALVAQRLGPEVVERLVEPMLGGVYAGHTARLSARATVPQLVRLAQHGSLVEQAAAISASYTGSGDAPVFACVPGGMGLLPVALAASGRFETRTGVTVRGVDRDDDGFWVTTGPTDRPEVLWADRVVIATPARATARLLEALAPAAAADLAGVEAASVVVVTLAFRAADVPAAMHESSGFLVPSVDGRRIKASTFSFAKWGWVREAGLHAGPDGEDLLVLRTSLGRHGEEETLQVADDDLVAASLADLAEATGLRAVPVGSHVQRWGGGLPQYAVGHLDLVERVRTAIAAVPGLSVCGATYDGVGIPAVIDSARRAVGAPATMGA